MRRVAPLAAAALLLAACVTRPPELPRYPEDLLLPGYPAYFSADVASNRALLLYLLDELGSDLGAVVGRTDRVAGALRFSPGLPAELSAVATGRFPRGLVNTALGADRSFERQRLVSGGLRAVYYRERAGILQVASPRDGLLYIATEAPGEGVAALFERAAGPGATGPQAIEPEVYGELLRVGTQGGPAATLRLTDPGAGLLAALGVETQGLPISAIRLSLLVDGEDLALEGGVLLRSEQEAALFGRLGRLFILLFARSLGLGSQGLSRVDVAVRGTEVAFSGIPVTRVELVEAVRRLSGGPRHREP